MSLNLKKDTNFLNVNVSSSPLIKRKLLFLNKDLNQENLDANLILRQHLLVLMSRVLKNGFGK